MARHDLRLEAPQLLHLEAQHLIGIIKGGSMFQTAGIFIGKIAIFVV